MDFTRVEVDEYAGYRGAERPRAFLLGERRHEVVKILDRWYEGGLTGRSQKLDYFKVEDADGRLFLLRYSFIFDAWSAKSIEVRTDADRADPKFRGP